MKLFSAIGTIACALSLLSVAPAWAQTRDQKAGARAAAEAGGDAFDSGKYAEAADLFERAERLMHAPPHLLYAARSHVKLGHLVEARELYLTLTRERLPDSASRVFRDAQQMGEKEVADIEPRIAYVSVVVQGAPASSVRVTRNNEAVPPELLGIPTPINPGGYSYQAFAEGMESTATSVKLAEGAKETVVLTLHAIPGFIKKAPAPAAAPGAAASGPSGSLVEPPAADTSSRGGGVHPMVIGSIAAFGVGAVGVGLGTFFIIKSSNTASKADAQAAECSARGCDKHDPQAAYVASLDSDTTTQQHIAIGSFIGGGVGIAAGITLLVLDSGRSRAETAHTTILPIIGPNYAGVAGRF